jgi:hypothetical protein
MRRSDYSTGRVRSMLFILAAGLSLSDCGGPRQQSSVVKASPLPTRQDATQQPAAGGQRPRVAAFPNQAAVNAKLHGQETSEWCWAASAQTIMDTIGTSSDIRQCTQAIQEFKPNVGNCCTNYNAHGCVRGGWPEFQDFGFNSTWADNGGLSFAQIEEQIAARHTPFAFTWNWVGGNAHMQVAYGYKVQNGQESVLIFNPLPNLTVS